MPKSKKGFFVGYEEGVKEYRIWYPDDETVMRSRRHSRSTGTEGHPQDTSPRIERELRNRQTLKRPDRYKDYVDIEDAFVAESYERCSYREAMECEAAAEWKKAMREELEALSKNHVWNLIEAPTGQAVVDNKWTFKLKRLGNGNVHRHRARLVARGFSQRKGIDYEETFSPVVRFDSIRAMLNIAASENLELQQIDVKTAFLYGNIEEDILMKQPEGYDDGTGRVCKLRRSLYGLKQSFRCWNKCFTDFLQSFNLKPTESDPCVFTSQKNGQRLILAIYIDDGLIMSKNALLIDNLLSELQKKFEITSGKASLFLGLQIERGIDGSIFLHQKMYAEKVLDRFHMREANSVTIPADPHQQLSPHLHPGTD